MIINTKLTSLYVHYQYHIKIKTVMWCDSNSTHSHTHTHCVSFHFSWHARGDSLIQIWNNFRFPQCRFISQLSSSTVFLPEFLRFSFTLCKHFFVTRFVLWILIYDRTLFNGFSFQILKMIISNSCYKLLLYSCSFFPCLDNSFWFYMQFLCLPGLDFSS
jgi:hypothetical protein